LKNKCSIISGKYQNTELYPFRTLVLAVVGDGHENLQVGTPVGEFDDRGERGSLARLGDRRPAAALPRQFRRGVFIGDAGAASGRRQQRGSRARSAAADGQ